MVEAATSSSQLKQQKKGPAPGTEPARVWSINDRIQQLAVQPVRALINLVGSKETTHAVLKDIIETGVREIMTKQSNVNSNYAPPLTRIQSYDLPSDCPRQIKRSRSSNSGEGFLKRNFFTSLAYNKPAVTIFVFDWRDWAKYVPAGEVFDWKEHEALILQQIKNHSDDWLRDLSVPSKYMIIVLFPQAQPGVPVTYNIDQCMQSFRKAVQLNGDDNIKSSNYFLSSGFEALKTGMQKKFVKNVHEQVVSYYREKKNNIKRKQKKLIVGQVPHIRYGMHMAIYSLITSNDFAKSIEKLDASYQLLKSTNLSGQQRQTTDEKRDNADVLAMVILGLYLQSNQLQKFLEFYRSHFRIFQKEMISMKSEQRPEELKWRACWFQMMGTLLERYYNQQGGLYMNQKQWHTQQSLDYFPGYYFLNAMLQLIARQQELDRIKLDCLATNCQIYDHKVLDCVSKSSSPFLGKDWDVYDVQNGGKPLKYGDRMFDEYLNQFRLYEENQAQLGSHILNAGQVAIGYYKQRSQLMKGPTGSLYMRTVNLINFHLAELLDRQGRDEELTDIFGPPTLTEATTQVSISEKQKFRRTIQSQLVKEKWTKEAVTLIEKSKANSAGLEEYFQNEMKILLHAHNLKNHHRHSRLMKLIEKVQSERVTDREPIKLTGIVQGTSLIWARARFENSRIQINKFNKLTLEVFSRLQQPIKISKLSIMMSQVDLSQEIDFTQDDSLNEPFIALSKANPIRLERMFYLNQEDDQIGQIMLNQLLLEVAPKKAAGIIETGESAPLPQNKLFFSISPYLAPEENLLDLSRGNAACGAAQKQRRIKRLPPPIMYSIEPLPQKIEIEAIQSDAKDQALLGDPFDIKMRLSLQEDVKLKSLKCNFLNFTAAPIGQDETLAELQGDSEQAVEGMVDVSLSQSSVNTGLPDSTEKLSNRMTASMFDPNMSQFYQSAKSVMAASMIPRIGSSLFIGADPSIGVAVLKKTKQSALRESLKASDVNLVSAAQALEDESEIQPVELYYSKGAADSQLTSIQLSETEDQADSGRVVELLNQEEKLDELSLKMIFYQEGKMNNLTLRFQYEFTQNQGIEDEAVHLKAFDYKVRVRAQSPFKVEWQVKSSDCFLASLQHFYNLYLGTNDQMRRYLNSAPKASTFDPMNQLAINEEVKALTGTMVAPEEQTCWLVCSLSSQSQHRDITIRNIRLHLNPEITDFVEVIDTLGCETSQSKRGLLEDGDEGEDDILCIEPGETYEVLFKLRVKKVELSRSYIQEDGPGSLANPNQGMNDSGRDEASIQDQVSLLKKLYKLQQVNLFAELHFDWASFQSEEVNLIDFGGDQSRKLNEHIPCCVGSPAINFVTRPLNVRVCNMREIQHVKLHEPFTIDYEIANLSNKVITALSELQTSNDGPAKFPFLISGEIKSRLHLMPSDEGYLLRYTLFPQMLGVQTLPRLTISDFYAPSLHLIKDFTIKVYVTST